MQLRFYQRSKPENDFTALPCFKAVWNKNSVAEYIMICLNLETQWPKQVYHTVNICCSLLAPLKTVFEVIPCMTPVVSVAVTQGLAGRVPDPGWTRWLGTVCGTQRCFWGSSWTSMDIHGIPEVNLRCPKGFSPFQVTLRSTSGHNVNFRWNLKLNLKPLASSNLLALVRPFSTGTCVGMLPFHRPSGAQIRALPPFSLHTCFSWSIEKFSEMDPVDVLFSNFYVQGFKAKVPACHHMSSVIWGSVHHLQGLPHGYQHHKLKHGAFALKHAACWHVAARTWSQFTS